MEEVLLLVGGNLGDTRKRMDEAVEVLSTYDVVIDAMSKDYRSAPWGYESQNEYVNRAVKLRTELSPEHLMRILQKVEKEMGRERGIEPGYADRMIDIDILLFGDYVIQSEDLFVPHPRMYDRKFALVPAAEIAPEMMDPGKALTIQELLDRCDDGASVSMMQ